VSAAVVWRGVVVPVQTELENLGIKTLRDAMAANGGPVTKEGWRETFFAAHEGKSRSVTRTAFSRVTRSLIDKHLIELTGGRYTVYRKSASRGP